MKRCASDQGISSDCNAGYSIYFESDGDFYLFGLKIILENLVRLRGLQFEWKKTYSWDVFNFKNRRIDYLRDIVRVAYASNGLYRQIFPIIQAETKWAREVYTSQL